jgi:Ca2+-binding RTX toxin-like protein
MATITEAQLTAWISLQNGTSDQIKTAIMAIWSTTSGKDELSKVVNGSFKIEFTMEAAQAVGTTNPSEDGKTFIVNLHDYLTGIPVGDNQFANYDLATMLSHELSHVISWNAREEEIAHMYNNGSYENTYTSATNYFKNTAGLSFQLTRDGYNIGGEDNWNLSSNIGSWNYYQAHKTTEVINATLYGGAGVDHFIGGNDTLDGGEGSDTLNGGAGYDTYISDNGDSIIDSDGKGRIIFEGHGLGGAIVKGKKPPTVYYSKADHGTYYRNGSAA